MLLCVLIQCLWLKSDIRMKLKKEIEYCGENKVEEWYEDDDGMQQGVCRVWYYDGQLREKSNYKDDKRHGLFQQWHKNGILKIEANYKNDELDGLHQEWFENGQLWERSNFKNGKYHGLYEEWKNSGELIIKEYRNKVSIRACDFYTEKLTEKQNWKYCSKCVNGAISKKCLVKIR